MKGEAEKIVRFFDGAKNRFKIPLYQRNYDWTKENCEQLFFDLKKLKDNSRKSHFFGSIVTKSEDDTHIIIDGQQRITTISLFFIALLKAQKDKKISLIKDNKTEYIRNTYLRDQYNDGEYKLQPIEKDAIIYKQLMEGDVPRNSFMKTNYDYFYQQICASDYSVDDWVNCVEKLEIIDIRLEKDDDPQLIFESLNSTGLALKESDKIRNYLLMSMNDEEQTRCYKSYWQKIERNTGNEPSYFFRDYLTLKLGKQPKIDSIYSVFKKYCENNNIERENVMEDMLLYSEYNKKIADASFLNTDIDRRLRELNSTGLTVIMPYLLGFFKYADDNNVSDKERYEILETIEDYVGRRIICNLPSNALTKVFVTMHKEVVNLMTRNQEQLKDLDKPYLEVLKYYLLQRQGTARFPDTKADFEPSFETRQVYLMPRQFRNFVLERMENGDSNEVHDVIGELQNPEHKISIEHIMPQTLNDDWKKSLGENYEDIHKKYLHTMANLTLTGYNSSYSNKDFITKRDAEHGFNDSNYRLNNFVKDCSEWTEKELKERQQLLFQKLLKLWPDINTDFKPAIKPVLTISLEDEGFDYTYKSIKAYIFQGKRVEVSTWKEAIEKICKECYDFDSAKLLSLVDAPKQKYSLHSKPWPYVSQFEDGLYVWSANSTQQKINVIRTIFDGMELPYSDLDFEFANSVNKTPTGSGLMHQQFWAQFNEWAKTQKEFTDQFNLKDSQSQKDWYDYQFNVGQKDYFLSITLNTVENSINAIINFRSLDSYNSYLSKKEQIESAIGDNFLWSSAKSSGVAVLKRNVEDLYDDSKWIELNKWLANKLIKFKSIMRTI